MDEFYMKKALELAKCGKGRVNPNPMVGAVIVKNNKIIGQGYHMKYGQNHAEINALLSLNENPKGATMYVTLEPCSHFGKTPPCVDKIIESKISKVVIASTDPNPLVKGRGVEKLRQAGIKVVTGVLDKENRKLNEVFMKYIIKKEPFVVMKVAMSLDGKIATKTGDSKWISCEESRKNVHKLRDEVMGILVGVNTVIKDDPMLTCRLENGKNPIRILVDTHLKTPISSKVVTTVDVARTIIVTTQKANKDDLNKFKDKGVEIVIANVRDNKVDLKDMLSKLGKLNIDSILLEGGATLNYSFIKDNLVDKIQVYVAMKLIGGKNAKTPIEGEGISNINDSLNIKNMTYKLVGEDILIEGYLKERED